MSKISKTHIFFVEKNIVFVEVICYNSNIILKREVTILKRPVQDRGDIDGR